MATIGVRELQQHASAVIRRAVAGEDIDITDRGRLVARIVPANPDPMGRLVESGRARPASRRLDDLEEPLPPSGRPSLSALLAGQRADER